MAMTEPLVEQRRSAPGLDLRFYRVVLTGGPAMSYVISGAEKGTVTFPFAAFESSVRAHWNGSVEWVGRAPDGTLVADIRPKGVPGFSVRLTVDGRAMSTDGTPAQVADTALWAISLLPPDLAQPVLLYDADGYRELRCGMSVDEVWSDWEPF